MMCREMVPYSLCPPELPRSPRPYELTGDPFRLIGAERRDDGIFAVVNFPSIRARVVSPIKHRLKVDCHVRITG